MAEVKKAGYGLRAMSRASMRTICRRLPLVVPVLLTTELDYLRFEDGLVNDPLDRPMLR